MENSSTLYDGELSVEISTDDIDEFTNSALSVIRKHASPDLLGKVPPDMLRKTFMDLWKSLNAVPITALVPDGGEIFPSMGLDMLILKDPRFANRTGKVGPLPNGGKGTFDQDAMRVMVDALLNHFRQTGNDLLSVPFGGEGEDSCVLIYPPRIRKFVLDQYELTLVN